jgi:hypothetical protein
MSTQYIFVANSSTGLLASGVVWTDSSFDEIGPGSYFLLEDPAGVMPQWRVDLSSGSFVISPSSALLSPPYLTPFVLGGMAQGNGAVQLKPLQQSGGQNAGAVQGWNYSPPPDPGTKLLPASGYGVWSGPPSPPADLRIT